MKLLDLSFLKKGIPSYTFVERRIDDEYVQVATKITSGKYEGLIFSIGQVSLSPSQNPNEEPPQLSYQYMVEHMPDGIEKDENFDKMIGDIIMDILEDEYASQK